MNKTNIICFFTILFVTLASQDYEQYNSVVQNFGSSNKCMPKCLQCEKGPNSCTKCTEGADCCNWACEKCENQIQCKACKQGYQLDEQLNICVFQYSCFTAFCQNCDDAGQICIQCATGYYLNTQMKTCEACAPKCLQCINNYNCAACQQRTFLQEGTCRPCGQNCQKCHNSTGCDICVAEYFQNENGKCQKCVEQCSACTSRKDCTQCKVGFYFDSDIKKCLPCEPSCALCKNHDECTSCKPNYYFNKTTSKCLYCNQIFSHCSYCRIVQGQQLEIFPNSTESMLGYSNYYDSADNQIECITCQQHYYLQNSTCKTCMQNCILCKNSSTCTSCSQQYFINQEGQCSHCIIYRCFLCKNISTCLICNQGFYWNPAISTNQCTKCPLGCTYCDQFDCQKCQIDFYLKNGNCYKCDSSCIMCDDSPNNCRMCLAGYFKTSITTGHCYKCPEPCIQCLNSTYCTHCLPQYYLSKNTCKKCQIQSCDQCRLVPQNISSLYSIQNAEQLQNGQKCFRCSEKYFLKDQKCVKCAENCLHCQDIDTCYDCQIGYSMNEQKKVCLKCPLHCKRCQIIKGNITSCMGCQIGYTLDRCNINCLPCTQNCNQCLQRVQSICISCKEGYYIEQSDPQFHKCKKCNAPCMSCENEKACVSCVTGYYLDNNDVCVKCQTGCEECSGEGCFICEPGYRLAYESLTCLKCKVDKCFKCQSSVDLCDTCEDGYKYFAPNSTGMSVSSDSSVCYRCDESIEGCRSCNSPLECTECFTGLSLEQTKDGLSTSCNKESNLTGFFIAIGVLSLIVMILSGVICILRWRKKRVKSQEKSETDSLIDKSDYSINSQDIISDRNTKKSVRSSFGLSN